VDAQTTFTLEIAVRARNLSRKRASNLQRGKYQDLIRGSLEPHRRSARQGEVGHDETDAQEQLPGMMFDLRHEARTAPI